MKNENFNLLADHAVSLAARVQGEAPVTDIGMERNSPRGAARTAGRSVRRDANSFKQGNRTFSGKGARSIAGMKTRPRFRRALPDTPPEPWLGKCHAKGKEKDVAVFFRRVWKKYIPFGLTLCFLKKNDLRLYNAINNYHVTYKKPWPDDLKMQTPKTRLASVLDRLENEGPKALTPRELLAAARKLVREKNPKRSKAPDKRHRA